METPTQTYFYSKPVHFKDGGYPIFKMNMEIYKTANMVDYMLGTLALFASYKACFNLYTLASVGFSASTAGASVFWGFLAYA